MLCLEHHTKAFLCCCWFVTHTGYTWAPSESGSSHSGLTGLLCQKSCPLTAGMSLHEQIAGKDGIIPRAWELVVSSWTLALCLLCLWSFGGLYFFFSLMRPFRTTFLHVAHPFGMRNVCERDVTSVTSWCSQSLFPTHRPVQYNSQKAMSAPCSIPCEAHLRKVKITV